MKTPMTPVINSYGPPSGAPTQARSLNLKYLNFGLFAAVIGLGIFYLVNISSLTVLGFVIRDLKSESAFLASEKLAKEEEVNRVRSYQALAARTKNLNMVAVGEVEYLVVPAAAVARK